MYILCQSLCEISYFHQEYLRCFSVVCIECMFECDVSSNTWHITAHNHNIVINVLTFRNVFFCFVVVIVSVVAIAHCTKTVPNSVFTPSIYIYFNEANEWEREEKKTWGWRKHLIELNVWHNHLRTNEWTNERKMYTKHKTRIKLQ